MGRRLCIAIVSGALVLPAFCQPWLESNGSVKKSNKVSAKKEAQRRKAESIGTATMARDGTIILELRAHGPDGTLGESRLIYPKNHKQYSEILKHLGGLKPGQSKEVPPWPDKR